MELKTARDFFFFTTSNAFRSQVVNARFGHSNTVLLSDGQCAEIEQGMSVESSPPVKRMKN